MILAQPVIRAEEMESNERIAVIDASAGMLASDGAAFRFVRAVEQVKELAEETFSQSGIITVILADTEASFVTRRADATMRDEVLAQLDELARCENGVPVHSLLRSGGYRRGHGACRTGARRKSLRRRKALYGKGIYRFGHSGRD